MIHSLQALRGVAVCCVLLMHLKFPIWDAYGRFRLLEWLNGGCLACGVDIFFVLSGFVISLTAAKQNLRAVPFMLHRLIRLMPLFWIASIPYIYNLIYESEACGRRVYSAIWNSLFLIPFFDKHHLNNPALPPGWTLSFEMWFYLLFALILIVLPSKKVPSAFFWIFIMTSPVPFLWKGSWQFPYFAFHPFCWEFALGCLAYVLSKRYNPANITSISLLLFGITGLIYGVINYEWLGWHNEVRASAELSSLRVLLWGVPSFLIVLGCVSMEKQLGNSVLITPLIALGNASYSIYLIHEFVYKKISGLGFISNHLRWKSFAYLNFGAALLVGAFVHHIIEKPMTRWLRIRFLPSKS